jgi:hypothetical protein
MSSLIINLMDPHTNISNDTSCCARALPQAYCMLIRCHGFVKKIKKIVFFKLYGETLLQSTMFLRKIKLQS